MTVSFPLMPLHLTKRMKE